MKKIIFPVLVLAAASAILLLSDLDNRKAAGINRKITRVAVFRMNSNQLQTEVERGVLDVLTSADEYKQGKLEISRYNAEGDMPTANTIAAGIVNEKFNMVVSISTPALQVMANANKKGVLTHVFCAVTDPCGSGVGIKGVRPSDHPAWLVGIGTFQPVEEVFRIARQMHPSLKRVGVVWCAGETCSAACVRKARSVCAELGIELVEMSVENVTQVYEAALAVSSKGVEAMWIGGDNVVESAIDMYVEAAARNKIPVFTNNPGEVLRGAIAALGANYFQVGTIGGKMALSVIRGLEPASIEIKNMVPEKLFLNDSTVKKTAGRWKITDALKSRADSILKASN